MIMCGQYIRVTGLFCAVLTLSPHLIGNGPKPQPNTLATWETCSAVIGSVMDHHCASPQMSLLNASPILFMLLGLTLSFSNNMKNTLANLRSCYVLQRTPTHDTLFNNNT